MCSNYTYCTISIFFKAISWGLHALSSLSGMEEGTEQIRICEPVIQVLN